MERNKRQERQDNNDLSGVVKFIATPSQHEGVILNILKDYVLWMRVADGVFQAINAHGYEHGKEGELVPETLYHGYETAWMIMGIDIKSNLADELLDLMDGILSEDYNVRGNEKAKYNELAQKIYTQWLDFLKDFLAPITTT